MQHLIKNYQPKKTPIIIDPLDPKQIYSLIIHKLKKGHLKRVTSRLEVIKERCELFLNGEIIHIQQNLEDVPKTNPELEGIADQIIENVGPSHHYFNGMKNREIEKRLITSIYAKDFISKSFT